MSLFIVLLQIFRVVVIQPCEFKTRHLRKQQGNLQFCYNFSSVLSQVKGLPVAKSHKKILFFKCSSTPERKVPQRSDASQNDHKSKGHPSKTSEAAFTMQKAEKGGFGYAISLLAKIVSKRTTGHRVPHNS